MWNCYEHVIFPVLTIHGGHCLEVVVVLGFYVPPAAKVIWRRDLGLKSQPKDWRSPGSNSNCLEVKNTTKAELKNDEPSHLDQQTLPSSR